MELAVWQRDYYYRQMVRWWLFSGSAGWVWPSGSSPGAATSSLGTDPPLEGTAGLAHSLAGKVVTRIMLETQDTIFFSLFTCRMVPDLDHIRVYLNEEEWKDRKNERKKDRTKKKPGQAHWEEMKIGKKARTKGGKRHEYTVCGLCCLSACPWINLVQNVRIEFLLWLRQIN